MRGKEEEEEEEEEEETEDEDEEAQIYSRFHAHVQGGGVLDEGVLRRLEEEEREREQAAVNGLVEMGYDAERARYHLRKGEGNRRFAVEWLIHEAEQEEQWERARRDGGRMEEGVGEEEGEEKEGEEESGADGWRYRGQV